VGISAALSSALFLGLAPVFGKQAILAGLPPLQVVAYRTLIATLLLLGVMVVFQRRYLFIYPAGLLGCLLAGATNGVGSLFYYSALGRLDAGVGHMLYSLYPLFLLILMALDHQKPARLVILRLVLAIPAVYLLTQSGPNQVDLVGFVQMLVAAALYALHIPINQRVLFDMPAPTVTLYTLAAMSAVVVPVYLLTGGGIAPEGVQAWMPLLGLTLVTFLSRLTLFLGVKHLGGMQTALLGLSELLVAVSFANLWLGERLSSWQQAGAFLLVISLLLVVFEKKTTSRQTGGWFGWLN
jgi:drug/metabolite transporter (DMT)-like permease